MARIGLNALYDAEAYPVDLSELGTLTSVNRTLVMGFLAYCSLCKIDKYAWGDDEARDLIVMASARANAPVEWSPSHRDGPETRRFAEAGTS